uniref:Inner nuclear membrane protein Man1 n=1 Tax=Caenorhabditis tropicalis TaxID=1561998 RepID=A0A1I7UPU3_9PELO
MPNGFLNNAYVNCCFFTTYAEVLSSAFKNPASWYFVNPNIGSPISPKAVNSSDTASSGYDTGSIGSSSVSDSAPGSPIQKIFVHYGRLNQKQRREMEKTARELMKQESLPKTLNQTSSGHKSVSRPSQFYEFGVDEKSGKCEVGMQTNKKIVKEERPKPIVKAPIKKVDKRPRAGNNRRRYSPKPVLPPKKKEPITIDEDGFQLVAGKKAAKLPVEPIPVVVEEVVVEKKKRVKKPKKYCTLPTMAMILHDMKQAPFDMSLLMDEEEYEMEENDFEIVDLPMATEVKKAAKKSFKQVKKEENDIVTISAKIQKENGIHSIPVHKNNAGKRYQRKIMFTIIGILLACFALFFLVTLFKTEQMKVVPDPTPKIEYGSVHIESQARQESYWPYKFLKKNFKSFN